MKGYVTEEVIEFCVDYMDELCPIGVPVSQHEGRLIGKGTLGKKSINANEHAMLRKTHLTILQQSALLAYKNGGAQVDGSNQVPLEV